MDDWRSLALDALRGGVEGATTGALGGPVDLATMLLRPLGYDVEKPVGGGEWWRDQFQSLGAYQPRTGTPAETVGEIAGSFAAPGPDPTQWASLGMGLGGVIRAYHGSPHTFDRFDMSKIGTGEGGQKYGRGLYFSESPEVAQGYRDLLGAGRGAGQNDVAARILNAVGGDQQKALEVVEQRRKISNMEGAQEHWDAVAAAIRNDPRGSFYTVDLDVEPEDLLDWDAPLSHQSEKVRGALDGLGWNNLEQRSLDEGWTTADKLGDQSGGDLYQHARYALQPEYTTADAWDQTAGDVSASLRAAGIPGIKYMGEFRRTGDEGARNFVLFDDALAKILERNGQPVTKP